MLYSKQLPTKPGWYWCKHTQSSSRSYEQIVYIEHITKYLFDDTAEWAGPIDKPSDIGDIIS